MLSNMAYVLREYLNFLAKTLEEVKLFLFSKFIPLSRDQIDFVF